MKRFFGILLIAAAAAAVLLFSPPRKPGPEGLPGPSAGAPAAIPPASLVPGLAGSEKMGLLEDPEILALLAKASGLRPDARKAGSVEMVEGPTDGQSFLWPASQVNLDSFRESGRSPAAADSLLHSPIVFYTWDVIASAFESNGVVKVENGVHYLDRLDQVVEWIDSRKEWKEIGVARMWGKVSVVSTDPGRSNSGAMFSALLATVYNQGEVPTARTVEPLLPRVRQFFDRLGHMEHSSGVLFQMFVTQGVGAYPVMVGYENQLIEFALEHPDAVPLIRQKVKVLYPRPTVWANHPFIALDGRGKELLQAMKDPGVLKLAWRRHGFRSGILAGAGEIKSAPFQGLPETIDAVMPTPGVEAMRRIAAALKPTAP